MKIGVIGGGIVGCSIAWKLARRGAAVTLFDRGSIGTEASWAAAGMLSPGGEHDCDANTASFYLQSRSLYPAFVEELKSKSGLDIDYVDCGAIELARTAQEWEALQARASEQKEWGIRARPLLNEQLKTFSPYVETEALAGALFYPGDGAVAPRDMMAALRVTCLKQNVTLRENTDVKAIAVKAGHSEIDGRPYDAVVLAAGAWSGAIAVSGVPPLPVSYPIKGHLMAFDLQLGACPTIVRHKNLYAFQRRNGMLIAGASVEDRGFDRTLDMNVTGKLLEDLTAMLPVLEKLIPVDVWNGLRPKADRLYLERWDNSSLLLAYGHYRNGILLAPATADRIADLAFS